MLLEGAWPYPGVWATGSTEPLPKDSGVRARAVDCSQRTPILEDSYWGRPTHHPGGTWGLEPGEQREQAWGMPPRESESTRHLLSPETKRVQRTPPPHRSSAAMGQPLPQTPGPVDLPADDPTKARVCGQSGGPQCWALGRAYPTGGPLPQRARAEQRQQEGSRKALRRP